MTAGACVWRLKDTAWSALVQFTESSVSKFKRTVIISALCERLPVHDL